MKLALHRSITFWSGLLVMAFIAWSALRSLQHPSGWYHPVSPQAFVCFGNTEGAFYIYRHGWTNAPKIKRRSLSGGSSSSVSFANIKGTSGSPEPTSYFPAPWFGTSSRVGYHIEGRTHQFTSRTTGAILPHWLVLLGMAALWLGLLFWRARRRAKPPPTPNLGTGAKTAAPFENRPPLFENRHSLSFKAVDHVHPTEPIPRSHPIPRLRHPDATMRNPSHFSAIFVGNKQDTDSCKPDPLFPPYRPATRRQPATGPQS